MRRAALYARVSTRRQEKEATIDSQIAQVAAYAESHGYDLSPERYFVDQAVSGKYLARPGLDRLRDAALSGAFEVVLCLSPDRLARQLGAQQVVLAELQREGVEMIFLNQPVLDDGPQAQLLLNIQGAFAEYERVVISDRMRRGKLYRLRQGQSVPAQVPYGYRFQTASREQRSAWVTVAAQAIVVEQMFVWYTQDNLSVSEVTQRLNAQAIPSPEGKRWVSSTVGRLLRQPAYKGTAYYNRHQADYSDIGQPRHQGHGRLHFPRYAARPAEEWIEMRVPPLVSEEMWQAAQEQLAMNARFAQRNSHRPYLLRGLLVCGTCGYTLQGHASGNALAYFCTHGAGHRPPGVARHTCSLRADVVEPLVWHALAELLRDPQQIQAAWLALQAQPSPSAHEVNQWQQRQTLLRQQRQRLLDAYQAEALSLPELIERQNPLELELRELDKRLAQAQPSAPFPISLETFTQRIERALTASDLETQQEVLRLLIERIVVTDEALTIEHIIPTVDNLRLHPTCHATRST
jgi:site-specific DNA recombinase